MRRKLQADDDIVGIVVRAVDCMSGDAVFRAPGRIAVKGLLPSLEVPDGVLNDEHRHGLLLCWGRRGVTDGRGVLPIKGWWTRTQRIRTAAELPFEAILTDVA